MVEGGLGGRNITLPSFAQTQHLTNPSQVKDALPAVMAGLHAGVSRLCADYRTTRRRSVHVTPKSYLSFLDGFASLYKAKLAGTRALADAVARGLAKMDQAKKDVERMRVRAGVGIGWQWRWGDWGWMVWMANWGSVCGGGSGAVSTRPLVPNQPHLQAELAVKNVSLATASAEAEALLKEIAEGTAEAEREKARVADIVDAVTRQAQAIAEVKAGAEADLAAAKPALDAALASLSSITPKDIGALKALKNPPDVVKRIFDCVLLLRYGGRAFKGARWSVGRACRLVWVSGSRPLARLTHLPDARPPGPPATRHPPHSQPLPPGPRDMANLQGRVRHRGRLRVGGAHDGRHVVPVGARQLPARCHHGRDGGAAAALFCRPRL